MSMYLVFCEETNYRIPPPPPNRVVKDGFFSGLIEAPESRRLGEHWKKLCSSWGSWSIDRRKAELLIYIIHERQVMGWSPDA